MHKPMADPLDELKQLLQDADELPSIPEGAASQATKLINQFGAALSDALDDSDGETATLIPLARREFLPLAVCSDFGARIWHKPLGYAGDWKPWR